ncbi:MAG: alpha-hydroxy-acid oxidizing protein, partial [Bifidobacteriaceae bacterium]|nr:alpha-hydroxy-acid oxidizing protein [Bifidobacteriaceae bacterium]
LRELPAAVKEVGHQVPVFLDGGVMHGIDIVAAIALGASGVFLSRAYLYGLMAGGERGVDRANQLLQEQLLRAMAYLGVTRLDQLQPGHVRLPPPGD